MKEPNLQRTKLAARFILCGLVVQLVTTLYWSPLTFILFTAVGVPLVVLGVGLYLRTVWRFLRAKDAV